MNLFGYVWDELDANTVKTVRVIPVYEHRDVREE